MHSRLRRLLIGATLTLLAVAGTTTFGASRAAAATKHASAKVHKITSCGYIATSPGVYEVTKNLTDAGGSCIRLDADSVTLYLDGHTITGNGTDTCIDVDTSGTALNTNEHIVGGTKAKPTRPATLTGCKLGIYVYWTSGTMASYINIVSPTSYGILSDDAGGMTLSHINVPMHSSGSYGIYLEYGADNVVTRSTVAYDGKSTEGFTAAYEIGDTFSHDTATDTYGGNAGTGFYDDYSSRDTWTHDSSKGNYYGFYFYAKASGPVTATYNTATGPTTSGSYGFYVYYAYQYADSGTPHHTLISHNKTNGFFYGFYDESDLSGAVAETWTNNTADNYSGYGFDIYSPTDYVFNGNVADAHTKTKKYDGASTTYGVYIYQANSYYPFTSFSHNEAYDNQFGLYSFNGLMIGGKGNIAKRNEYNSYQVEITG